MTSILEWGQYPCHLLLKSYVRSQNRMNNQTKRQFVHHLIIFFTETLIIRSITDHQINSNKLSIHCRPSWLTLIGYCVIHALLQLIRKLWIARRQNLLLFFNWKKKCWNQVLKKTNKIDRIKHYEIYFLIIQWTPVHKKWGVPSSLFLMTFIFRYIFIRYVRRWLREIVTRDNIENYTCKKQRKI